MNPAPKHPAVHFARSTGRIRKLNLRFCGIASRAVEAMRAQVLQGKKVLQQVNSLIIEEERVSIKYCKLTEKSSLHTLVLNQLFTLPEHQRRGAGSMLLTWPFEDADEEGMVCYLDTEADGKVIALCEEHGYVKVAECEMPLEACGLEGFYTHVALVREPKPWRGSEAR